MGAVVNPTYFRPGTLHKDDGTVHNLPLPADSPAEEWILVDGTPASCVQIGLFHFFKDKGPVDMVVSGPNYGRNTTAVFGLSSGTLGGAMEAAVCRKKAVALSYAFFSRNHDPAIIASATKISVRLVEHLYSHWNQEVDVYSINVPLVPDVDTHKILYTNMLQNYWSAGSSFREAEVDAEDESPAKDEQDIRTKETKAGGDTSMPPQAIQKPKCFKWAPKFSDVYRSVEESSPGNDGWAIQQGHIRSASWSHGFLRCGACADGPLTV